MLRQDRYEQCGAKYRDVQLYPAAERAERVR